MRLILFIIIILLLIGALPAWPYSSGWGYYPSGGLGLVLVILLILLLFGAISSLAHSALPLFVMRGLDPRIHLFSKMMNCRVTALARWPGNDARRLPRPWQWAFPDPALAAMDRHQSP